MLFPPIELALLVLVIAFAAEYMDSTLGMGYGTTLTPVLLLLGFAPLEIVPAVLLSQLVCGLFAGVVHHRAGNVDFRPRGGSPRGAVRALRERRLICALRRGLPRHLKVALLLAGCGVLGTAAAVTVAVRMSPLGVKLYIGIMTIAVGLYVFVQRRKRGAFSWKRMTAWGLVASFNKGISGGGYGPIVTAGQILSGVEGRSAVAVTSLAEGITCIAGFGAYLLTTGVSNWGLLPLLLFGSLLSVPLSAGTVKRIRTERLTFAIGCLTVGLGCWTLFRALA